MDGTLTDQQVAIANKITANQYDNISTTNIVSGRTKCFYINNDVLSDMELEKEKENRNIIEIILEWLFSTYYEKNYVLFICDGCMSVWPASERPDS